MSIKEKAQTIAEEDTTLVILDEADNIVLDKRTNIEATNVIGLTATASNDLKTIEGQFSSDFGWEVIDSMIASELDCPTPYESISSVEEFFKATEG